MKPSTLKELNRLRQVLGEGKAGTYLQRLLALTLVKAGYSVEERTVEGPDLEVGGFQIEVKTTTAEPFSIGLKDERDIEEAVTKGKTPLLALLEFSSFRGWILVKAKGLQAGDYHLRDLALRRVAQLEQQVNQHFDEVVQAWLPLLLRDPVAGFELMDRRRRESKWQP